MSELLCLNASLYNSCALCVLQVWQSSDSVVNVCSELDWKRCVAVHLWFMLPPTASVADALARYEAAFQVSCCRSLCAHITVTLCVAAVR